MKSVHITLFFFLTALAAQSQTCIIIYVSNKGITAGADRKYHQVISNKDQNTGEQKKTFSVYYEKKIFTRNDYFWALSGADYYDTIHTICNEACIKNRSLQKTITFIQKRFQSRQVKTAMHELLIASDEEQKQRFKANLTEIAFFKFDDNAFKAYRLTLSMPGVFNKDERLHFETDSIVATKKTVGMFVLGHYDAFADNTQPETWIDPVAIIRMLIKKQSESTPDDVSAESDIIQITKDGYAWIKPGKQHPRINKMNNK